MVKQLKKRAKEDVEQLKDAVRLLRYRTTDISKARCTYNSYA